MLSGLDSSVLNDKFKRVFGFYREIKEMKYLKFIEFYDVRAAEAALRALNMIEIAGKHIKLELGHPRRWIIAKLLELESYLYLILLNIANDFANPKPKWFWLQNNADRWISSFGSACISSFDLI
ncbi:MEI2-like protein, putative [Medicago truncatula]|uniref:MEI2-like protein, putative n=1 Tax=Medicago truncatula TaxID=3880 RepID=A0A072UXH0_MEDTR|nr:MEI2-like protein, putative [Medicago truncatula]